MTKIKDIKGRFVKKVHSCNGLRFRCETTTYVGSRGEIVSCVKFRPQKRLSCPGCARCGGMLEYREYVEEDCFIMPDRILDGSFYGLVFVNGQANWESGLIEDYELEMRLLTNKDLYECPDRAKEEE